MGSLIRSVPDLSRVGYGVNILESLSPAPVQGVSSSVVGIVAHLPWGPTNTLLSFNSVSEALAVVAPRAFAQSSDAVAFPALMALLLPWPGALRLIRVAATDAEVATLALMSGDTVAQTVNARYPGAAGNAIKVEVMAATNGNNAARNVIVTIGSVYRAVYENLTATTFPTTDPYVTFSGSALPAVAAVAALTGGDDGVPIADDYLGTSEDTGLNLFEGEAADANIIVCAGANTALAADVNTGIQSFMAASEKYMMAVLCTEAELSAADVQTDVTSYRSDRLVYAWPRVSQLDTWLSTPMQRVVDGNAFVACAMASVAPEVSPGGANGVAALNGIVGLEAASPARATLDALKAAGVCVFFMASAFNGVILRGAVTTDLDSRRTTIYRRRMTDYIALSLARALEQYTEKPLDLTFNTQGKADLGLITSAETGVVIAWLEGLKQSNRIAAYQVDPYSLNTPTTAAANQFLLSVAVRLFGAQEEIVLVHRIGPGENVSQSV